MTVVLRQSFDWGAHSSSDPDDVLIAQLLAKAPEAPRAALLGVPFDGAVLGRRGAREGPDAIRRALAPLKPWRFGALDGKLLVGDAGDVPVEATHPLETVHGLTEAAAEQVARGGAVPIALGGDHSLTYPLALPHASGQRLGIVNLDAHMDLREARDGAVNSGTSFGRLLRSGHVRGEDLVEVGLRDHATSPAFARFAEEEGVALVPADAVRRDGAEAITAGVVERLADVDAVYLSVDLDVLDQAHGPGVSAPTPGGLTTRELLALVAGILEGAPVVAMDMVELAPRLDEGERTARAAAFVVAEALAILGQEDAA